MVVHQDEGVNLGPEPVRQFRNQSEERPAVVVPAEHGLPTVAPAHYVIPTIDNVDAKRSCHQARLGLRDQLSIVRD